MIRAHLKLPCIYLAQEKIVDRLNIPALSITVKLYSEGSRDPSQPMQSYKNMISISNGEVDNILIKYY